MVMMISLFLLVGCGDTSPETLVDELRVMASVAEPPEVRPDTAFTYNTYLANPDEDDVVSITWVCTNLGDGCLEAQGGSKSIGYAELNGSAPVWEQELSVSPVLMGMLDDEAMTATQVWTLACTRGTCPIIDEVKPVANTTDPWPESIRETLANPLPWMSDLPMQGVSLAYQLLSTSLSDTPHQNPRLAPDENVPESLTRNKSFSLTFNIDGILSEDAQVYNYISGGGFKFPNTFVTAGATVTLEGVAPKSDDETRVWVVLTDGLGGVAVWTEEFSIE